MSAIPDLTQGYFSRGNIPFGSFNTTTNILEGYHTWASVHVLLNLLTTGNTGGVTRPANTIYFCRGSSDGVGGGAAITSPGVVGTNLWWNGGVYPGLVRGSNGTNHHWILLECTPINREILFNWSQNAAYVTISWGPIGTFTGGSATTCPSPSPTTNSVQLGQTGYSGTDGGQYNGLFGDYSNTGGTNYLHFTCGENGNFYFTSSRAGGTGFSSFWGLWNVVNPPVGDTNNTMMLVSASASTANRGVLIYNQLTGNTFVASRTAGGAQKVSGGILIEYANNSLFVMNTTADSITSKFDVAPMIVADLSPVKSRRGMLSDAYMVGLDTVGAPLPSSLAPERVIIGDTIWPAMVQYLI